jgi:hypothetical protein
MLFLGRKGVPGRETELEPRDPLRSVTLLPGHRPIGRLPSRSELSDEIFEPGSA